MSAGLCYLNGPWSAPQAGLPQKRHHPFVEEWELLVVINHSYQRAVGSGLTDLDQLVGHLLRRAHDRPPTPTRDEVCLEFLVHFIGVILRLDLEHSANIFAGLPVTFFHDVII